MPPRLLLVSLLSAGATGSLVLLAVLQGLTEFLPVSSSGHLVLAQAVMELNAPGIVVDVALHVGTLLAILVVYREDVGELAVGLFRGAWREPWWIVLGTLPAVAVGLFARERVERAFESPRTAAFGLLVTAALLAVGELARRRRAAGGGPARVLSAPIALSVGLAQALAICPGISRSGATIAAGLFLGLAPARAARFSFLLAIPAILGAAVLQASDGLALDAHAPLPALLLAILVAAVVGFVALRFLLSFLGRGAFAWFAVYCLALGSTALALGTA